VQVQNPARGPLQLGDGGVGGKRVHVRDVCGQADQRIDGGNGRRPQAGAGDPLRHRGAGVPLRMQPGQSRQERGQRLLVLPAEERGASQRIGARRQEVELAAGQGLVASQWRRAALWFDPQAAQDFPPRATLVQSVNPPVEHEAILRGDPGPAARQVGFEHERRGPGPGGGGSRCQSRQACSDHDHIPVSSHTAQTGGPVRL
jgi:hypothetical protein